jgi:peptidyl-dipeptidase Dcp
MTAANPLLDTWDTLFELPPFERIEDDHFEPALESALDEGRAAIRAIAENPEPPTFANTIEALELADATLDRVAGVFFNLAGSDANPVREALQRDFAPKFSAYSSEIVNNAALFARIADLWERRESLGLTPEQMRVLMLTHRSFVRSGAALDGDARDRLTEVKSRLAVLGTSFAQNLLADEREWFMPLSEADLEGLPDFVIAAARAAGEEKDAGGPVVTLSRSLIVPFLQFSPRRDLREKAYKAWAARGARGGETDNRADRRRGPRPARGAREAPWLSRLRRLQARDRDGGQRRTRARASHGRLGPRPPRGRGRCRGARGDDARGRRERPAGTLGLALLRREAAQGRARSR